MAPPSLAGKGVGGLGLILLIVATGVGPWVIDNQFVLLMVSLTGITYLAALGLSLVMGFAGQVSLGHAALVGVGAYSSAIVTTRFEQPFLVGMVAAGVLAGLVGLLLGIPSLRLAGPYLAMATMAFNLIVQRLMINWSELTGGPDGLAGLPGAQIGPIVFDRRTSVYLVGVVALGGLLVARNLVRSRYGRGLLAMREDELAASCLGVDLYRSKLLAFGLSAVYAGLAGSLFAYLYRYISPISFGLEASLELLLAVILAGSGTLVWPLAGALVVTVLPQLPVMQSLQELRLFVYGGLLLVSVVVWRRGLAGAFRGSGVGGREAGRVPGPRSKVQGPRSLLGREREERNGGSGIGEREPSLTPAGTLMESRARPPTPDSRLPTPDPLLELTDVTKRFGGVVALEGVGLRVEAGTIHGLIGPNGSGKTTALNVISGLERPDSGAVRFVGRSIGGLPPHRLAHLGLARTFQNLRLFGELSVLENVQVGQHRRFRPPLGATLLGLPAAREAERGSAAEAAELASRLGLGDVLALPARELAHGRQRQVELGRALAARPSLLLLDEPAAGLSGAEIEALRSVVEQARAEGVTVLMVEHHLDLILELCDRVTVLDRGRVIADGTPAEIRADPEVARAYLGSSEARVRRSPESRVPGPDSPGVPSPESNKVSGSESEGYDPRSAVQREALHHSGLGRGAPLEPHGDSGLGTPSDSGLAGGALLEVRGGAVRYGRVTAVEGLDLEVREGEIVAVLGANGAGKSSLLRAVSGLVPLAEGSVRFEGRLLGSLAAYRRPRLGLAQVPEGRLVFADQSVEDNLRLGAYARYFGSARGEIEDDLERLLVRFPALGERRRVGAGSLSGGEQQQLAVARALMARPKLLLLDEPSLGLAPRLVDQVFELLAELRQEGVTILLVEQLAYRALELADRAYVLRAGRCVLSGPAAAVASDPSLESAYLGGAAIRGELGGVDRGIRGGPG